MSEELREEKKFSHSEAGEILERAAEIQQDAGSSDMAYTEETIEAGAKAAGIQEEFVDEAIDEIKFEREERRKRQQALRRKVSIGSVVVGVLLVLMLFTSHRGLNGAQALVDSRRAQLETVLQRRHDLIPNLISVAKSSAAHEKELIASLDRQQKELSGATEFEEKLQREQQLGEDVQDLLGSLRGSGKGRTNQVFLRLHDEFSGAENRVAVERKRYNEAAAEYNRVARSFPTFLLRPLLGFAPSQPFLQASPAAQRPPEFR